MESLLQVSLLVNVAFLLMLALFIFLVRTATRSDGSHEYEGASGGMGCASYLIVIIVLVAAILFLLAQQPSTVLGG